MTDKKNLATVRIYIDGKEMLYSHQNIVAAINSWYPYLTNDDLNQINKDIDTLLRTRKEKEVQARLETEKHSWPYPDTISRDE